MTYKVLVIDDELEIAASTAEYFNMFDIKTAYVTTYEEGLMFLEEHQVSLVLLDINLGEKSGFELCREIRKKIDIPILFISARTSDDDILTALNIGGDDYIKKPYTLNVLMAKVKVVLNRYGKQSNELKQTETDGMYVINDRIKLDCNLRQMTIEHKIVKLKEMEFRLLQYLITQKGRVVTKEELFEKVWKDNFIGDGTIAVHIRHLREKMERNPNEPELIKTVWGVGYVFEA